MAFSMSCKKDKEQKKSLVCVNYTSFKNRLDYLHSNCILLLSFHLCVFLISSFPTSVKAAPKTDAIISTDDYNLL